MNAKPGKKVTGGNKPKAEQKPVGKVKKPVKKEPKPILRVD